MLSVPFGPLKLLIVAPTVDPEGQLSAGGAERMARNLCLKLDQQRIQPLLATYIDAGRVGEDLRNHGVKTFVTPKRGKICPGLIKGLRQIIVEEKVDAVLSMYQGVNLFNLLATYRLKNVARLIRIARVGIPWQLQATEGLISHWGDVLIANSQAGADAVRGAYTIPPSRYRVIPNGCDTTRFSYVPYDDRHRLRDALGLPPDAFIIYTPNRIHENKGQDLLAEALLRIPEQLQRYNIVWVNTGLVQHEETAERIEKVNKQLPGRIRLLKPTDRPQDWMAASDAVVIPSRTESFPNTLLEASSVGRPVVVTACGAAVSVGNELGAITVPPTTINGLVTGLAKLVALPEVQLAERGLIASRLVRERYSIESVAEKYAEVVTAAVRQRRGQLTAG